MEVSTYNIVSVPITIAVLVATTWLFVVILSKLHVLSSIAERILASSIATVLVINAEVYVFSALPLAKPLYWLPLLHTFILVAFITWTIWHWGWQAWVSTIRELRKSLLGVLVQSGPIVLLLVLLVAGLMTYYFLYGAYTVTWEWDAVDYHVPMAVQPYQDGRIGHIGSNLPWTDAYPRGVELVWYWTLQWTQSDLLFHPVQLAFGLQLLLASYVLARRSGVATWGAISIAAVIGATPLVSITTTTGSIDIAYGASVVAMVAFLAPPLEPNQRLLRDWFPAILAYGQACLIKVPVLATLFFGLALVYIVLFQHGWRAGGRGLLRWFTSWRAAIALMIIVLCCESYITNVILHSNPIYPIAVSVGNREILPGSLIAAKLGQGASTSMGDVAKMSAIQRYYASWADLFQPLNLESFGSTGPVFIIVIAFGFALFAFHALSYRNWWHVTLVCMFCLGFLVPASFLPRYSIPMIAIGAVGAFSVFQSLPSDTLSGFRMLILVLSAAGSIVGVQRIQGHLTSIEIANGGTIFVPRRNLAILEGAQLGIAGLFPTPQTIRFLRDHSGAGDVLAWNVRAFQGMLWNRTYSNRVVFVPGSPDDIFPSTAYGMSNATQAELEQWSSEVRQLQPKHILLYLQSSYSRYLQSNLSQEYHIVYQDQTNQGQGAMVIFERSTVGHTHDELPGNIRK